MNFKLFVELRNGCFAITVDLRHLLVETFLEFQQLFLFFLCLLFYIQFLRERLCQGTLEI